MAHSKCTGRLVVHDRLARYGANYRVFEIQFTSIIRFGRSALLPEFRKKKEREGPCLIDASYICHRLEWEPEKNASQSS